MHSLFIKDCTPGQADQIRDDYTDDLITVACCAGWVDFVDQFIL